MRLNIIASLSRNGVIGVNGQIPWRLPKDMAYFKKVTMGHVLLMGRGTYESLPAQFRPLSGRYHILLSQNQDYRPLDLPLEAGHIAHSLDNAIATAERAARTGNWNTEAAFIIGGGSIYEQTLRLADQLFLTHIDTTLQGDTFLNIPATEWECEKRFGEQKKDHQHAHSMHFAVYRKRRSTPPKK